MMQIIQDPVSLAILRYQASTLQKSYVHLYINSSAVISYQFDQKKKKKNLISIQPRWQQQTLNKLGETNYGVKLSHRNSNTNNSIRVRKIAEITAHKLRFLETEAKSDPPE